MPEEQDHERAQALADSLEGALTADAAEAVQGAGLVPVVVDLDAAGGRVAVTADYRPSRVRLFVAAGRVVRATHG